MGAKLFIKDLFQDEQEVLELSIEGGIPIPNMRFAHEVKVETHKLLCKLKGLRNDCTDVYTVLIYNK